MSRVRLVNHVDGVQKLNRLRFCSSTDKCLIMDPQQLNEQRPSTSGTVIVYPNAPETHIYPPTKDEISLSLRT